MQHVLVGILRVGMRGMTRLKPTERECPFVWVVGGLPLAFSSALCSTEVDWYDASHLVSEVAGTQVHDGVSRA